MKINLGCGDEKLDGFIGIDIIDNGQEYILDLNKDKIPADDNTCEYIRASHFLEHLKDTRLCLNECWRVLKKGGIMKCWCPYGYWKGAHNPTHFQFVTAEWFAFLRRGEKDSYGMKQWDILELKEIKNNKGEIYEIYCKMSPVKE